MKQFITAFLLFLMTALSSCEVVGSIFKAGMWTAVLIIGAVVLLIVYLVSRSRKK